MLESKIVEVEVGSENETVNVMQCFGWFLQNGQEICIKDNYLTKKGNDIYSVRSTERYTKLTFQRDTKMKNYKKIVELEKEYEQVRVPTASSPEAGLGGASILSIIIGLIVGIVTDSVLFAALAFLVVIAIGFGISLKNDSDKDAYRQRCIDKKAKIAYEASQLVE